MSTIRIHWHSTALHLCPTAKLLQLGFAAIRNILPEVTDVAPDFLVRLEAKRDNGDEAECEPFPALHHFAGLVAAVLALECYVFGTFEGGCEGVCSASKEEEHDRGLYARVAQYSL